MNETAPTASERNSPSLSRFPWRLVQFRLRTLLILTTLIAAWLGWWSYKAREQRAAVLALRAAGVVIDYDFDNTGGQKWVDPLNPPPRPTGPRYWPAWLVDALGVDYFANVESVSHLSVYNITDSDLSHLKKLPQLKYVHLWNTPVTDRGLEYLRGLTALRALDLRATPVTDAGLEHLKSLSNLQHLWLEETNVTNAGVERLQRALPNCKIIR